MKILLIIAIMVVVFLLWPKRPKKTLAEQSREFNKEYYADKKPRQF